MAIMNKGNPSLSKNRGTPPTGVNLFGEFSDQRKDKQKVVYNPGAPYSEEEYHNLKNLFGKTGKKSANTKVKALQDIIGLCQEASDNTIFLDLLPSWIHTFNRLTKYETENQVREKAYRLQEVFFKKFRTGFAEYIEEIFNVLWIGRNDPAKEVSLAARNAFDSGFRKDKQKNAIEMGFNRFFSDVLCTLRGELAEEPAIVNRLMRSGLLGISDALKLSNADATALVVRRPQIWTFLTEKYSNDVRAACLYCINSMLDKGILAKEHLDVTTPEVFKMIGVRDKDIQTALWGTVLINYMKQFPQFRETIKLKQVFGLLLECLKKSATGAGQSLYPILVRFLSIFNQDVLRDPVKVNRLLEAILDGRNSEDGAFAGNYLINAFYEVILYLCIKIEGITEHICPMMLAPVEIYLKSETTNTLYKYINQVPELLAQTLSFLESKDIVPEIQEPLQSLLGEATDHFKQRVPLFIAAFTKPLKPATKRTTEMIRSISSSLYRATTDKLFENIQETHLKFYVKFVQSASKLSEFAPDLVKLWEEGIQQKKQSSDLLLISQSLQQYPEQWLAVLKSYIVDQGLVLLPEKLPSDLGKFLRSQDLSSSFSMVFQSLEEASTMPVVNNKAEIISRMLAAKLTSQDVALPLAKQFLSTEKNDLLGVHKSQKIYESMAAVFDVEMAQFLAKFLFTEGWKSKIDPLWEVVKGLPTDTRDACTSDLLEMIQRNFDTIEDFKKLLTVLEKLTDTVEDPLQLTGYMLSEQNFRESYTSSKPWSLFESLAIKKSIDPSSVFKNTPSIICHLFEYPTAIENIHLQSVIAHYVESSVVAFTKYSDSEYLSSLILAQVKHADTFRVTTLIMIKRLKEILSFEQNSKEALTRTYEEACEYLEETGNIDLLCEITELFKHSIDISQYIEPRRTKALSELSPINIRLYASCLPDEGNEETLEGDISILGMCQERTFAPEDLTLALNIVRRGGGFLSIEPFIEVIELRVIELLVNREAIHLVLPYLEHLLGQPSFIFNPESLLELVVALPRKYNEELTGPEVLELAETLSRLHSIVSPNIDERSLYWILAHSRWQGMQKAVLKLLSFVYSNWELTTLENIPDEVLETLNFVPDFQEDSMSPQVLGYFFTWILLLRKYNNEKRFRRSTEFTDALTMYLQNNDEVVSVFLMTLMEYVHVDSRLDTSYEPEWVDLTEEVSISKMLMLALYEFLGTFPSIARRWWLGSERLISNTLETIVKQTLSAKLLKWEIDYIDGKELEWREKDLKIRYSRAAKEITADIVQDEFSFTIILTVSSSFPLSPPSIEIKKNVKIKQEKIEKWKIEMIPKLHQQNWRLLDVLMTIPQLILNSINNIEQCWICYCFIHASDKSLPDLPCKECNYKFHKMCIQKWFNTSSKSNCPLCQNPFK